MALPIGCQFKEEKKTETENLALQSPSVFSLKGMERWLWKWLGDKIRWPWKGLKWPLFVGKVAMKLQDLATLHTDVFPLRSGEGWTVQRLVPRMLIGWQWQPCRVLRILSFWRPKNTLNKFNSRHPNHDVISYKKQSMLATGQTLVVILWRWHVVFPSKMS